MKSQFKNRRSSRVIVCPPLRGSAVMAYTLHDNIHRWPTPIHYTEAINHLNKHGFNVMSWRYEIGEETSNCQSGKLHLHGVLELPSIVPHIRSLLAGMNMMLKPLFNFKLWDEYLCKQKYEEIDNYLLRHFWNMDTLEYDFESEFRYTKPIMV